MVYFSSKKSVSKRFISGNIMSREVIKVAVLEESKTDHRDLILINAFLLFSVEIFLRKENLQFSSRRFFFFFLKLPKTRRVQVCRVVGVLYNTCIACHGCSESRGGGFESRYRPYHSRLFRYSLTSHIFSQAKFKFFSTKL